MISSIAISLTMAGILLAQNGTEVASVRQDRRIQAMKIAEPLTIDGQFNEREWTNAPMAGAFTQREPNEAQPATENTEIRVLYDNDNLYFAVYAHDSQAERIIINELRKDFNTDTGDAVEIILDTFHDERNAYRFATNPAGAKWDAQMANEGRENNANWDGVWFVQSRVVEDGWTAEIAIPFKTLKFANVPVQTWGLNFSRNLRRRNEESLWAPVPRIYGIERLSFAGTLEGIEGVEPGANIKLKPYAVSSVLRTAATDSNDYDGDIGFDLKYGVTSGLTWDFTYNTDFSQVEADEQQINLSRFSLFFPEKRDFFLENSGIFQFGSNQGGGPGGGGGGGGGGGAGGGAGRFNQQRDDFLFFHSRNIGLSPDGSATIPILGGTRLTGRIGAGFSLGLLNIQQQEFGKINSTNFTVARIRKNIFASSDIGFMMTDKEVSDSPQFSRVMGADANIRLGQRLDLNAYVARSSDASDGPRNLAGKIGGSYQDTTWTFRAAHTSIQENFTSEMGFVPRSGIRKTTAYGGYAWRPQSLRRLVRQINPHWDFTYIVDRDGNLDTRYIDYHLPFNFQNGSFIEIGVNPSREYLSTAFTINRNAQATIPAGVYTYYDWFVVGNSDRSKPLSGNLRWSVGPFYTGYKHSYVVGATYRANYKLTTSFSYTHNNISLPEAREGRFKTNLFSTRANVGFSTSVFLNALVQYNSDSRQWSSNVRFNVIHRPLSDIFIVYNERRNSLSGDLIDRALVAKMTYMISR